MLRKRRNKPDEILPVVMKSSIYPTRMVPTNHGHKNTGKYGLSRIIIVVILIFTSFFMVITWLNTNSYNIFKYERRSNYAVYTSKDDNYFHHSTEKRKQRREVRKKERKERRIQRKYEEETKSEFFNVNGLTHKKRVNNLVISKVVSPSPVSKPTAVVHLLNVSPTSIPTSKKVQQKDQKINQGEFLCPDNKTIGTLNDDYCDCPDGSDEPKTSACSHLLVQKLSFRCYDGNFNIHASRVNDGILDCKDGSDEILVKIEAIT